MASAEPSISKGSSRSSTRPRPYKTAEVLIEIFNDSDSNEESDSDDSDVPILLTWNHGVKVTLRILMKVKKR